MCRCHASYGCSSQRPITSKSNAAYKPKANKTLLSTSSDVLVKRPLTQRLKLKAEMLLAVGKRVHTDHAHSELHNNLCHSIVAIGLKNQNRGMHKHQVERHDVCMTCDCIRNFSPCEGVVMVTLRLPLVLVLSHRSKCSGTCLRISA